MIERVADFFEQYKELGRKIQALGTAYNDAAGKLKPGGHSITTSAKQVITLGTKLSKGKEINVPDPIPEIEDVD